MDFGNWGDPNHQGNTLNTGAAATATDSGNQGQKEGQQSAASIDGSEMMHQFEHPGVFCDACNMTINGFRYKCLQCQDYDLCTHCERRGHHAGHVMMRIAFPEQAPEAIKRYFENQGANDASSGEEDNGVQGPEGPHAPRHGHPGKGRRHPHPWHPHHHGKKHQKKWRKAESDSSDDDGAGGGPAEAIPRVGCPYVMGKKEMKKYAKQMKKMAYMQKKAEKRGDGGSDAEKGAKRRGVVDYGQCISQIQQYLNGFGIPIDVVTLYDEWGNGIATTKQTKEGTSAQGATDANNVDVSEGAAGASADIQNAGASDLCDKLQNVRIETATASAACNENTATETARKASDGECGGDWTMLDDQAEANNQTSATENSAAATAPVENAVTNNLSGESPSIEPTSLDNGPVKTTWTPAEIPAPVFKPSAPAPIVGASNTAGNTPQQLLQRMNQEQANLTNIMSRYPAHMRQAPFPLPGAFMGPYANASVGPHPPVITSAGSPVVPLGGPSTWPQHFVPQVGPALPPPPQHPVPPTMPAPPQHPVPPTTSAPPTSTGNPSAPSLYPRIPPPFPPLMDILHGVSTSVGNAVRSVGATLPTPAPTSTTPTNATACGGMTPQMNATLNQLLSMGFSNHDGWLARLVQAKKGDMDAVLTALFDRNE